jgi:hypothetical protein
LPEAGEAYCFFCYDKGNEMASGDYFGFNTTQADTLARMKAAVAGGVSDNAVTSAKIATGAVTSAKLGASSVIAGKIAAGTIVNADISNSAAIALSKLANVAAGSDNLAGGTLQTQVEC